MDEKNETAHPLALTEATFKQALADNPVMVVDFWAPWCMPCRMLAPIIERLAAKAAGRAVFAKVNVDECPSLAQEFNVMSIPMLVFFKNGEKVDQMVGVVPEQAIEAKLGAL